MNKELQRNKQREELMRRELIERMEEAERKDMDMNLLKYEVSQLPYKI